MADTMSCGRPLWAPTRAVGGWRVSRGSQARPALPDPRSEFQAAGQDSSPCRAGQPACRWQRRARCAEPRQRSVAGDARRIAGQRTLHAATTGSVEDSASRRAAAYVTAARPSSRSRVHVALARRCFPPLRGTGVRTPTSFRRRLEVGGSRLRVRIEHETSLPPTPADRARIVRRR